MEEYRPRTRFPKSVILLMVLFAVWNAGIYIKLSVLTRLLSDECHLTPRYAYRIMQIIKMTAIIVSPFAGILSDIFIGNYKQCIASMIATTAATLLLLLSEIKPLGLPPFEVGFTSIIITTILTSFMLPCRHPLAGDQLKLLEESKLLSSYFMYFYWLSNISAFVGVSFGPVMSDNIHCFDRTYCLLIPFAASWLCCFISTVILALAKPLFIIKPPIRNNPLLKIPIMVPYALKKRITAEEKRKHWLDHADDKFGRDMIEEVKELKMVYILLMMPFFWAIYAQKEIQWLVQARRMNTNLGFCDIPPEKMYIINHLLCVILIPVFDRYVYPLLEKKNFFKRPLARIAGGGVLLVLSFVISALILLILEDQDAPLPSKGEAIFRIYNPSFCAFKTNETETLESIDVNPMDYKLVTGIQVNGQVEINGEFFCDNYSNLINFTVTEGEVAGYYLKGSILEHFQDDARKEASGLSKIRTVINTKELVHYQIKFDSGTVAIDSNSSDISTSAIQPGVVSLIINGNVVGTGKIFRGGVYVILVYHSASGCRASFLEITQSNSISIVLMLPQYILVTSAEVMFSISLIEFSYTQAPKSMKALMQGLTFMIIGLGDVIIVAFKTIFYFDLMSVNSFACGGVMLAVLWVFIYLAIKYKYVEDKIVAKRPE